MINDMALLKRTMQQMDAEDPTVAQAAKDRAAQLLSDAKLNFSKMAELIEQRRLLLPPAILARIRKMDQPGMLGDAAFQDTGTALRREGQSFLQIAEAIEASGTAAPAFAPPARYEAPVQENESHFFAMDDAPSEPALLRALLFVGRIVLFPVRHPLRSLAIALFALVLLYGLRGAVVLADRLSGSSNGAAALHRVDTAISSVGSFINEQILRRSRQENASPTPSAPAPSPTVAAAPPPSATPALAPATVSPPAASPSPAPTAASAPSAAPSPAPTAAASAPSPVPTAAALAPPATAPARAPNESATLAPPVPLPPPAAPPDRPDWTPRREARSPPPSRSPANRPRAFQEDTAGFPRSSRSAGPCRGGVGGCYWGGGQF